MFTYIIVRYLFSGTIDRLRDPDVSSTRLFACSTSCSFDVLFARRRSLDVSSVRRLVPSIFFSILTLYPPKLSFFPDQTVIDQSYIHTNQYPSIQISNDLFYTTFRSNLHYLWRVFLMPNSYLIIKLFVSHCFTHDVHTIYLAPICITQEACCFTHDVFMLYLAQICII